MGDGGFSSVPAQVAEIYGAYDVVEVVDLAGNVTATSDSSRVLRVAGEPWFQSAAAGQPVLANPAEKDGAVVWAVAHPITGADGRPTGVVVGDLEVTRLADILSDVNEASEGEIVAVDPDRNLVYSSRMGRAADDADLLEPVADSRRPAIGLVLMSVLAALGFASWFARRTTRPILDLSEAADQVARGQLERRVDPEGAEEVERLGQAFNAMVESLHRLVRNVRAAAST